jgi:hypothetical protein
VESDGSSARGFVALRRPEKLSITVTKQNCLRSLGILPRKTFSWGFHNEVRNKDKRQDVLDSVMTMLSLCGQGIHQLEIYSVTEYPHFFLNPFLVSISLTVCSYIEPILSLSASCTIS